MFFSFLVAALERNLSLIMVLSGIIFFSYLRTGMETSATSSMGLNIAGQVS